MDHPRIQSDPKVMMGKPVIRGTRITVEHILRCLAAGDSSEQLLSDYPRLTLEGYSRRAGIRRGPPRGRVGICRRMMVRLFADGCVAGSIIEQLRSEGFDIVKAADICPTADDDQVLAEAYREGRVLITADKDFGELVVRQGHQAHGVVNLALGDLASATRARIRPQDCASLGIALSGAS